MGYVPIMDYSEINICSDGSAYCSADKIVLGIAWVAATKDDRVKSIHYATIPVNIGTHEKKMASQAAEIIAATAALESAPRQNGIHFYTDLQSIVSVLKDKTYTGKNLPTRYERLLTAANQANILTVEKCGLGETKSFLLGIAHKFAYFASTGRPPVFIINDSSAVICRVSSDKFKDFELV